LIIALKITIKWQEAKLLQEAKQINRPQQRYYDFDQCLADIENSTKVNQEASPVSIQKCLDETNFDFFKKLGDVLMQLKCYDDALEYFQNSLNTLEDHRTDTHNEITKPTVNSIETARKIIPTDGKHIHLSIKVGNCLLKMKKYDEAKTFFERSLQITDTITQNADFDFRIASINKNLGSCFLGLNAYESALNCFQKALKVRRNVSQDVETDPNITSILHEMACCYYFLEDFSKSIAVANKSLFMKTASCQMESDRVYANTLLVLGSSLSKKKRFNKAQVCLDQALKLCDSKTFPGLYHSEDAYTMQWLGYCWSDMNKIKNALKYFKKSLQITENVSLDVASDRNIAYMCYELSWRHSKSKKQRKANDFFERTLEIINNAPQKNIKMDQGAAIVYYRYGHHLLKTNKPNEAKLSFGKALEIYLNLSSNVSISFDVANTHFWIGRCWLELKMHKNAELLLVKALEIYEELSIDNHKGTGNSIANACFFIACCLLWKNNPNRALENGNFSDRALSYFERALQACQKLVNDSPIDLVDYATNSFLNGKYLFDKKVYHYSKVCFEKCLEITEYLSLDVEKDNNVAATSFYIGRCLMGLKKPKYAKVFFERACHNFRMLSDDITIDIDVATSDFWNSLCLHKLKRVQEAKIVCENTIEVLKRVSIDAERDPIVANRFFWLGRYLIDAQRPDLAQTYFEKSLLISKSLSSEKKLDRNIALLALWIGRCLLDLRKTKSEKFLLDALEIYQNLSIDIEADSDVANTNFYIGCLHTLKNSQDAETYFKTTILIYENLSYNDTSYMVASHAFSAGEKLKKIKQFETAKVFFEKALKCYEKLAVDISCNRNVEFDCDASATISAIGLVQFMKTVDAELFFVNAYYSSLMQSSVSAGIVTDCNIANAAFWIGRCLHNREKPSEAKNFFQNALNIYKTLLLDQEAIALTTYYIGRCLIELDRSVKAKLSFEETLEIYENISFNSTEKIFLNEQNLIMIANTSHWIGCCLKEICRPVDAKLYFKKSSEIYKNISPNNEINCETALGLIGLLLPIIVVLSYYKYCS